MMIITVNIYEINRLSILTCEFEVFSIPFKVISFLSSNSFVTILYTKTEMNNFQLPFKSNERTITSSCQGDYPLVG